MSTIKDFNSMEAVSPVVIQFIKRLREEVPNVVLEVRGIERITIRAVIGKSVLIVQPHTIVKPVEFGKLGIPTKYKVINTIGVTMRHNGALVHQDDTRSCGSKADLERMLYGALKLMLEKKQA